MKKLLSVVALLLVTVCANAETVRNGSTATIDLAAGQKLTVTTGASEAIVQRFNGASLIDTTGPAASTTTVYGEYFINQQFSITALTSPVTYSVSQSTDAVRSGTVAIDAGTIDGAVIGGTTAAAITGTTITADTMFSGPLNGTVGATTPATVVGTTITANTGFVGALDGVIGATTPAAAEFTTVTIPNDVVITVNAGAPDDAVRGTLSRNPAGDDNALTYQAVAYGTGGNSITVTYADPSAVSAALSVSVASNDITVNLATDAGTASSVSINPAGDENALTYTAVTAGADGDNISIEYVDPSANDAALSVDVVGDAITVNLATDGGGSITSTAALVLAAIEASGPASALVTVAIDATDTGGVDDGSGVVTAMALDNLENGAWGSITSTAALVLAAIEASGPASALVTVTIDTGDSGVADDGSGVVTALTSSPLTGGAGTSIGVSGTGSLVIDYSNGKIYINAGTQAVPVWDLVTSS